MVHLSEHFQQNIQDEDNEFGPVSSNVSSIRCKLRLLESIEKARKTISGDDEAKINIECLMNDEDLRVTLTREQFEVWVNPQLQQLRNLLE